MQNRSIATLIIMLVSVGATTLLEPAMPAPPAVKADAPAPTTVADYTQAGDLLQIRHKWREAIDAYNCAIDLSGTTDVWLIIKKGQCYERLGESSVALNLYRKSLAAAPNNVNLQRAISNIEQTIKDKERNAQLALAADLAKQGKHQEAFAIYNKIMGPGSSGKPAVVDGKAADSGQHTSAIETKTESPAVPAPTAAEHLDARRPPVPLSNPFSTTLGGSPSDPVPTAPKLSISNGATQAAVPIPRPARAGAPDKFSQEAIPTPSTWDVDLVTGPDLELKMFNDSGPMLVFVYLKLLDEPIRPELNEAAKLMANRLKLFRMDYSDQANQKFIAKAGVTKTPTFLFIADGAIKRSKVGRCSKQELLQFMDPSSSSTEKADVDFGPYLADLQRRIGRAWFPPKITTSEEVAVVFKVNKMGEMSLLRLDQSSNYGRADQAALLAVKNAAPFRPLPDGSADEIDVRTIFSQGGTTSTVLSNIPGKTENTNAYTPVRFRLPASSHASPDEASGATTNSYTPAASSTEDRLGRLEVEIFGKTIPHRSIIDRLTRLELTMFPNVRQSESSVEARLSRIESAVFVQIP